MNNDNTYLYYSALMGKAYQNGELFKLKRLARLFLAKHTPSDGDWRGSWRTATLLFVPIDVIIKAPISGSILRCYERAIKAGVKSELAGLFEDGVYHNPARRAKRRSKKGN